MQLQVFDRFSCPYLFRCPARPPPRLRRGWPGRGVARVAGRQNAATPAGSRVAHFTQGRGARPPPATLPTGPNPGLRRPRRGGAAGRRPGEQRSLSGSCAARSLSLSRRGPPPGGAGRRPARRPPAVSTWPSPAAAGQDSIVESSTIALKSGSRTTIASLFYENGISFKIADSFSFCTRWKRRRDSASKILSKPSMLSTPFRQTIVWGAP